MLRLVLFFGLIGFLFDGAIAQDVYRAYNDAYTTEIAQLEQLGESPAAQEEINEILRDWNEYLKADILVLSNKITSNTIPDQLGFLENEKAQLELILKENLARLNGEELPVVEEQQVVVETQIVDTIAQQPIAEMADSSIIQSDSLTAQIDTAKSVNADVKGLWFKVQVAALSTNKAVTDLQSELALSQTPEVVADGKLFKYLIGKYATYAEAKSAADSLKTEKLNPFVVAYLDGQKIPLSEALKK